MAPQIFYQKFAFLIYLSLITCHSPRNPPPIPEGTLYWVDGKLTRMQYCCICGKARDPNFPHRSVQLCEFHYKTRMPTFWYGGTLSAGIRHQSRADAGRLLGTALGRINLQCYLPQIQDGWHWWGIVQSFQFTLYYIYIANQTSRLIHSLTDDTV